ncbi:hypothetical protein H6F50_11460 [Coleofasciculus sp. FACHB-712]|uniref:hypothetical protein n=1 Tax=Coleofasciculus sp. FACHB-712 TaxID=2692789 RepID=UPI0016884F71|nr:hypothetical protein [Coleofasciculus sp. FACHB-712]MBD1942969.1 hypothetical protein [Coleofasciculus sp. FACHB-712]
MADFEILLSDLPNLADSVKLTVGNANEIKGEISRITNVQQRLEEIQNHLNEALEFEKNKNMAFGVFKFVAPIATFFIPGGFFVEALVGGALGLAAEKLGNPDEEASLEDLCQTIDNLIEWGDCLKEFADDILGNAELLKIIKQERQSLSLTEQVKQIDEGLRIYLEFDDELALKRHIQQIKAAQAQLRQLQPKLDNVIQNLERNVEPVDRIMAFVFYFGKSIFAIDWVDDEEGLILSHAEQVTTATGIFNECESLKQKTDTLVDKANKLRGQAEQSLKQLEKQKRREKDELQQQGQKTPRKIKKSGYREAESANNRRIVKTLLALSILPILSFLGWKTWFEFPQSQQVIANVVIPVNTGKQKQNFEQGQAAANLETAQKLAIEAANMVQNAPHPVTVWQQSTAKWQEAVKLLEAIPEGSSVSTQAKEKLAAYQTNYTAINNRLVTEQKAVTNLEAAQKLAWEAAVIVQNPPHPLENWQDAQSKLQQAINLLNTIPQGTFVGAKAKDKLANYQINYNTITNLIKYQSPLISVRN